MKTEKTFLHWPSFSIQMPIQMFHHYWYYSFGSVTDFSNTRTTAPTSAERAPFFTRVKGDAVRMYRLDNIPKLFNMKTNS